MASPVPPVRFAVEPAAGADGIGHAEDATITTCWTPLLGPAAACTYRALRLVAADDPVAVPVDLIAAALGLGARRGRLVVPSALDRLSRHRLLRVEGDCGVLMAAAPPPPHLLARVEAAWAAALATLPRD